MAIMVLYTIILINTTTFWYKILINSTHVKMARAALGWSVRDLAKEASISPTSVTSFEKDRSINVRTLKAMEDAFANAGIEFIEQNGVGVIIKSN
jgi:transcriptional regulator with XRE-family HTH domain